MWISKGRKNKMKKQKFDIYNLLIGIIYLIISWIIYSEWGLGMSIFFIFMALVFIVSSFFNKNIKHEVSKFMLFSYLFVMLCFAFPFILSIYKKNITETTFVFLMAIVFFILYLREIKSVRKSR